MKGLQGFYYWLLRKTSRPDERGERSAGYWQAKVRQVALASVKTRKGRLLEIGCGEGLFLSQVAQLYPGLELWGVDRSVPILKRAVELVAQRGVNNVNFTEATGQGLPFEASFFDIVVCINMLMCIRQEEGVRSLFEQAARVLKPGGRFIVEMRNSLNPFLRIKYGLAKYYDGTLQDNSLRTFRVSRIRSLLEACGFSVREERFFGFPPSRFAPIVFLTGVKT